MRTLFFSLAMFLTSPLCNGAVNINTATNAQLETLNGIGPVKADHIIRYRLKNGPFKALEDLKKVDGVGDATFDMIKSQITLSGPTEIPGEENETAVQPKPTPVEEPDTGEYLVHCDKDQRRLTIGKPKYVAVQNPAHSAKGSWQRAVNPGNLTKAGGTDMEPLMLPAGSLGYVCALGTTTYRIGIQPGIHNSRVMGQCGAAEPTIALSLSRNGKQVISNLWFEGCQSGKTIQRLEALESEQVIYVRAYLDETFLPISVERRFHFSSLPADIHQAVFEETPTGDLNVDLFLAVYNQDLKAVQSLLSKGANPNARDRYDMPPLAWILSARKYAAQKPSAEDVRLSIEIAEALFKAGASGAAVNSMHGATLLDELIGTAPLKIIELLLTNGANVREGFPLNGAARRGNVELMQRLIDAGANPNKKDRGGTTAIHVAATSGFYTWSGPTKTPPIAEYAKCVQLLLSRGAKWRDGTNESESLLTSLVRNFGKDERLEVILAELIPYADQDSIRKAYDRAASLANGNDSYVPIANWLQKQVRKSEPALP